MKKLRVAVLMGGTSNEREISLSTGRQILAALDRDRYIPMALDAATLASPPVAQLSSTHKAPLSLPAHVPNDFSDGALVPLRIDQIISPDGEVRPDVVIIALHGRGGEDGTVQGMLELLGIPYTGSGVLASALAMNKAMTKRLLKAEGIPVPAEIVVERRCRPDVIALHERLMASFGYPVIVKPNEEGSTIGCTLVFGLDMLEGALQEAFRYDSTALVEQYIQGVEITVGLLGNEEPEVLPIIEIVPHSTFYDYRAKYEPGGSTHIIPARISDIAAERARDYAVRCHRLIGCRGMSRVDLMVAGDQPYLLEVNTIPGMTPTSLLPEAARAAGIEFSALLDRLIGYALQERG